MTRRPQSFFPLAAALEILNITIRKTLGEPAKLRNPQP